MDQSIAALGSMMTRKGVAISFETGVAYIISDTSHFQLISHHQSLVLAHVVLMEALQATYGASIPDVEFVIGTADMPEMFLREARAPALDPNSSDPNSSDPGLDAPGPSDPSDTTPVVSNPVPAVDSNAVADSADSRDQREDGISNLTSTLRGEQHSDPEQRRLRALQQRLGATDLHMHTTGRRLGSVVSSDPADPEQLKTRASQQQLQAQVQQGPHPQRQGQQLQRQQKGRQQQRRRALSGRLASATPATPELRQWETPAGAAPPLLMLRFCKSAHHADVLVPDIHFQTRAFTHHLLHQREGFNRAWPWESKHQALFGRFSPYSRTIQRGATTTYKTGVNGTSICRHEMSERHTCDVRRHFMRTYGTDTQKGEDVISVNHSLPIDVSQQPKYDMMHHASFRHLLHLDGQTCSSRLEQLFALNSLVFKEESGYYAFYHRLIRPYQHYLPFWTHGPEEIAAALTDAIADDARSLQIATRAQDFVATHLHAHALSCYWFTVLSRIAPLLRYAPSAREPSSRPFKIAVSVYLAQEDVRVRVGQLLKKVELYAPLGGITQGAWLLNLTDGGSS
ncbi:MAG: hypothetical protein WDW38_005581 [Sanguina aurantia]